MSDELFRKISELVAETSGISIDKISRESEFQKLGMDSLDTLALISDLEAVYKIKIPNQELLKIKTIEQAVETLQKRIS